MYPAPMHPYTFSPDVAVVLAVVTVVVGVVVATVPAMGRGNGEGMLNTTSFFNT